jgi:membrane-bound lytic murein transglycosylase D
MLARLKGTRVLGDTVCQGVFLSRIPRLGLTLALGLAFALGASVAARAQTQPFPEPKALEPAVAFWVRVYTEASTDGGFIHDARLMDVVYEHVRFSGETRPRVREKIVDARKKAWREVLESFAEGNPPRNAREQQIVKLFTVALGREPTASDYRDAKDELRFQLGQRDKFRDGLVRSGAFEGEMRAVFREQGLPEDLALLPHVESSFNVRAYSKYGAAGVWQFMRGTGRRFMKVDYVVDERLDPITATRAAARLLRENYELLGTWPLALTAYNHGAAGMGRAVRQVGTDQIEEIVANYESRSFGFASRNFYAQFLAARKVISHPESYFGPVKRDAPRPVDVVVLPVYADVGELRENLGVSPDLVAELNPALRPPVFRSGKRIPRGYALRLPAGTVVGDASTLLAALPATAQHGEQHENRYYTVRRGDTLTEIASENRTSVSALVAQNDLGRRGRIYPGQVLQLPDRPGARPPKRAEPPIEVAKATPAPEPPAVVPEPPVVAPEPAPAPSEPAPVAGTAPVAPEPTTDTVAAVEPERAEPETTAEAETDAAAETEAKAEADSDEPFAPEDLEAAEPVVLPAKPRVPKPISAQVALAEPAVARDEEVGPPGSLEGSPYRRVDKDRVLVDDDETLGHFADWLEVSPQRLRNLNKLKPNRPIHVGQKLKLDFSRVSPDEFQERRLEYHKGIEEDFFGSFRVTGTVEHVLRSGDTLWILSHKLYGVPSWLIHRYNPDLDFEKLTAGMKLSIPVVEKLGETAPANGSS